MCNKLENILLWIEMGIYIHKKGKKKNPIFFIIKSNVDV